MFFNISNHPCFAQNTTWTTEQVQAANKLAGEVIDFGFPACEPDMSDEQIAQIAHATALDIVGTYRAATGRVPSILHKDVAAMVAGHYIMVAYIVGELQAAGIPCYVGDSTRVAEEVVQDDGTVAIVHRFKFAGFRKYPDMIVGGDKIAMAIAQG